MTSHLVINGVKLGQQYPIDDFRGVVLGVVNQGSVELAELVHGLVAHQSLSHEQNQVGGVHVDQLRRDQGVGGTGSYKVTTRVSRFATKSYFNVLSKQTLSSYYTGPLASFPGHVDVGWK